MSPWTLHLQAASHYVRPDMYYKNCIQVVACPTSQSSTACVPNNLTGISVQLQIEGGLQHRWKLLLSYLNCTKCQSFLECA